MLPEKLTRPLLILRRRGDSLRTKMELQNQAFSRTETSRPIWVLRPRKKYPVVRRVRGKGLVSTSKDHLREVLIILRCGVGLSPKDVLESTLVLSSSRYSIALPR